MDRRSVLRLGLRRAFAQAPPFDYEQYLPGNVERFCELWGRGYHEKVDRFVQTLPRQGF